MNSEITSACCGSIWTISSMIRYVVRNRNLNLATAMAASSAISEDATTATSVTNRLFFRKFQYGSPMTLPSSTVLKLARVGWLGSGCGGQGVPLGGRLERRRHHPEDREQGD